MQVDFTQTNNIFKCFYSNNILKCPQHWWEKYRYYIQTMKYLRFTQFR